MDFDRRLEDPPREDAWRLATGGPLVRFAPAWDPSWPPSSSAISPSSPQGLANPDNSELAPEGPSHRGGLDLRGFARSSLRMLIWSLPLGLTLGLAAALAAWKLMPGPNYSANALFRVSANANWLGPVQNINRDEFRRYQQTQETLIKSDKVVSSALSMSHIAAAKTIREAADPLHLVQEAISVVFDGEILKIQITLPDEGDALKLVNAIADVYKDQVVNDEERKRQEKVETLRKMQEKTRGEINNIYTSIIKKTEELGTSDPAFRAQIAQQSYSSLKEKFDSAAAKRLQAHIEAEVLNGSASAGKRESAGARKEAQTKEEELRVLAALRSDSRLVLLEDQARKLESQKSRIQKNVRAFRGDPAYAKVEAELSRIRGDIERRNREIRTLALAAIPVSSPSIPTADSVLREPKGIEQAPIDKRIAYYEKLQETLAEDLKELDQGLAKLGATSADMDMLRFELKSKEESHRQLNAQLGGLAAEVQAPHRIELFEMANRASENGSRKRVLATAGAGFGSIGAMVLIFGLLEYRVRRVVSPQDITGALGLKLIGALPDHSLLEGDQSSRARWHSRTLESIDSIRATLLHQASKRRFNTIMITSACENEGKTTLACQLALSVARSGRRTLLIDADLRHPSVHYKLGLDNSVGLAEVLRGEASIQSALLESESALANGIGGLKVLTAGSIDAIALLALGQERFGVLMRDLKRQFDLVIVDCAPVLPVADALLVSSHADSVLIAVRRNHSRLPLVAQTCEKLETLGASIAGAVLAGIKDQTFSKYYEANFTTPLAMEPDVAAESHLLSGFSVSAVVANPSNSQSGLSGHSSQPSAASSSSF